MTYEASAYLEWRAAFTSRTIYILVCTQSLHAAFLTVILSAALTPICSSVAKPSCSFPKTLARRGELSVYHARSTSLGQYECGAPLLLVRWECTPSRGSCVHVFAIKVRLLAKRDEELRCICVCAGENRISQTKHRSTISRLRVASPNSFHESANTNLRSRAMTLFEGRLSSRVRMRNSGRKCERDSLFLINRFALPGAYALGPVLAMDRVTTSHCGRATRLSLYSLSLPRPLHINAVNVMLYLFY